MARPVCYDLTHLVVRMMIAAPSGIDKVDLAYGRHYANHSPGPAVHYGLTGPHVLQQRRLVDLIKILNDTPWVGRPFHHDPVFARTEAWLLGKAPLTRSNIPVRHRQRFSGTGNLGWRWRQLVLRLTHDRMRVPDGAVYLNVAQLLLEYPIYFRWLARRPDISAVFLIHDLLPLDFPEYWREGLSLPLR